MVEKIDRESMIRYLVEDARELAENEERRELGADDLPVDAIDRVVATASLARPEPMPLPA